MSDAHARDAALRAVSAMSRVAHEGRQRYAELDAVSGDGDFGLTLDKAWGLVDAALPPEGEAPATAGQVLHQVALAFSRVGGTTGPVWGTGFLRAATRLGDATEVSAADLGAALHAAAAGISERGGAQVGDKTVLDALVPVADALQTGDDAPGPAAARAAREGADGTGELVARRGRAAYQGESSAGPLDPGAVAVADMVEAVVAELTS